jgi:hypothetical protein
VGVPYLLSREVCHRLGSRWLAVIDSFPQLEWTDVMPAFAIAAALEQVPIIASDLVDTNGNHARQVTRGIVHYCYGDDTWNKRSYHSFESPLSDSRPSPQAEPGSVLAEILTQIAEARRWFAAEQREVMIASAASAP